MNPEKLPTNKKEEKTSELPENFFDFTEAEYREILNAENALSEEQKEEIRQEIKAVVTGVMPPISHDTLAPTEQFRGMPNSARDQELRAFWLGLQAEIKNENDPITSTELLRRISDTNDRHKKAILKSLAIKLESWGR